MDEDLLREVARFKRGIGGSRPSRRRFPPALRPDGVRLCLRLREASSTHQQIAEALGVSRHTVQRWLRGSKPHTRPAPARELLPVVLRPAAQETAEPMDCGPTSLVLVSPTGWRLEGLRLEQLVMLLEGRGR